jgi:hypothetical protein
MIRYRQIVLALAALAFCAPAFAQGSPTVYVTDGSGGHIYSVTLTPSISFPILATIEGATLEGIEYGPDGLLFVCDPTNGKIYRVNPVGPVIDTVFWYSGSGPQHPQCGRFSSTGDFYVVDESEGSGVWKFTAVALAGSFPATATHVLSGTALGSTFAGDSSLTQANNGDLLISDFSNGRLFLSLASPPSPALPYSSATQIVSGLDNQTGIARSSNGDIFIAQKGLSNRIVRYSSTGTFISDCGVFGSDRPYFIKFSADDTLYVATSQDDTNEEVDNDNDPFINGKIWEVDITSCSSSPTLLAYMPNQGDGEDYAAIGIALPPTSTSLSFTYTPTMKDHIFNFNSDSIAINFLGQVVQEFTMTMTKTEVLPADLVNELDPTKFPVGTTCDHYSGEAGFCVTYSVSPPPIPGTDFTGEYQAKVAYLSLDNVQQPALGHELHEDTQFSQDFLFGYSPVLTPGDPGKVGSTDNFSKFVPLNKPFTGGGNGDNFCGFLPPLMTNRVFKAGQTIAVKFQITTGINCTGAFITDSEARLSVVGGGNFQPVSSSGKSNTDNYFRVSGKQYIFNLNTKGYAPGIYSLTIFGDKFAPQTIAFQLR